MVTGVSRVYSGDGGGSKYGKNIDESGTVPGLSIVAGGAMPAIFAWGAAGHGER